MPVLIRDLTNLLEEFAPLNLQESYDNCGLLTGSKSTIVTGALITLDVTEAIIDEAIENKCNLIVAHHPLIFSGLKKLSGNTWVERTLIFGRCRKNKQLRKLQFQQRWQRHF